MVINLTKRLFVLAIAFSIVFCLPGMALATSDQVLSSALTIFTPVTQVTSEFIALVDNDFTPLENQKMQGIRQRRNREIAAVLDAEQRQEFIHELHIGKTFTQALEGLNLQAEQRNLIKAIMQLSNLKTKVVLDRHSLYAVE
jgi:hypothetical protein